jgi:hypothetical protein
MNYLWLYLWLTMTPAFGQGVIATVAGTDSTFPTKPMPALDAPQLRMSGGRANTSVCSYWFLRNPFAILTVPVCAACQRLVTIIPPMRA